MDETGFSRRGFLRCGMAGGALLLAGGTAQAQQGRAMVMHRAPGCGCCLGWVEHARRAGYTVSVREDRDMAGLKRRLGVPQDLSSCHTIEAGGYLIEGHVPLADVTRLLRERPRGVRGIAVPGMPMGSPGMEGPSGRREAFTTFAFDSRGGRRVFARHAAG